MRFGPKNWSIAFLFFCVFFVLLYKVVASETRGGSPAILETAIVFRGPIENTIAAMGRLQPVRGVDVGAQVSGQLRSISVAIGDNVRAGQLIAEIDPNLYLARVESSRAGLAILQDQLKDKVAQLVLSQTEHDRKSSLARKSIVSQSNLETQQALLESAKLAVKIVNSEIKRAEATLRIDEINLQHTRIHSPIDGTIISQSAFAGQTLSAIQDAPTIVGIADLGIMTVEAYVSEADILRLLIGKQSFFSVLGDNDRRWTGKLRQINPMPEVKNNVILYKALFDVDNADRTLRIGMTAQVFFIIEKAENVLNVPLSSLRLLDQSVGSQNAAMIDVQRDNGLTESRVVKIGIRNRVAAEIVDGLREGERVVVNGR